MRKTLRGPAIRTSFYGKEPIKAHLKSAACLCCAAGLTQTPVKVFLQACRGSPGRTLRLLLRQECCPSQQLRAAERPGWDHWHRRHPCPCVQTRPCPQACSTLLLPAHV